MDLNLVCLCCLLCQGRSLTVNEVGFHCNSVITDAIVKRNPELAFEL